MLLRWATDVHLDYIRSEDVDAFALQLYADPGITVDTRAPLGAAVITGDISNNLSLQRHLRRLGELSEVPIFFVLGNHDFWDQVAGTATIADTRAEVAEVCAEFPNRLFYLPTHGVARLSEKTALIGVDGSQVVRKQRASLL